MYKFTATAKNPNSTFVNIRADHSASASDIGDLLNGQKASGDVLWANSDGSQKWLQISDINGVAKTGWVAVVYNGQALCELVENATEPPASTSHHLEVIIDGETVFAKDF